jgi:hypothetical protein
MKARSVVIALATLLLVGCRWLDLITYYEPEYLTYEDLRRSIVPEEPRDMTETGKIYVSGNYVFVNEYHEGIHVVDTSDLDNPVNVWFVPIPGNVDVAVKGSTMYADSYVDLVALDISDPLDVVEVGRLTDVFPFNEWMPWFGDWTYTDVYAEVDANLGIVTGWNVADRKLEFSTPGEVLYADGALDSGGGAGVGGSMARFTVVDNYLYALHDGYIELFDVSAPTAPAKWTKVNLSWDIETIFPYQDRHVHF